MEAIVCGNVQECSQTRFATGCHEKLFAITGKRKSTTIMLKKIIVVCLATTAFSFSLFAQTYPYQNPRLSADERAKDLLGRMTLREKISQTMNGSPAIDRLGIPAVDWWNEALHGVARAGKATVFPQTIGLAATFDTAAVYETYNMISDEARAKHHEFKRNNQLKRYQGLTFWTPNINILRDPRWGRGMETYGEDPFLTASMGVAVVKGLQGDGTQPYDKTHACAKHYAVHSGPEWSRHSFDAKNVSQRDLWETYLPAFKALVTQAKVKEVMCAYNRFEGEPCCSSKELLVNILRTKWKFDDIIVSDCGAIKDFYAPGKHETHPSAEAASADAVISGTDLACDGSYAYLESAVNKGLITEADINKSVFRLLRARIQLGMFDDDSLVSWSTIPYSVVESKEHVAKALEMARKSMVLLSNKNNILPLSKSIRRLAVVGPNANDSVMLWANYNGIPSHSVTILDGIRSKLPTENVIYEKGCSLVDKNVFYSYINACQFDGKPGFKATFRNSKDFTGPVAAIDQVNKPLNYDGGGNTVFAPGVNLSDFSARFETVFTAPQSGEVVFTISADDGYRLNIDDKEALSSWGIGKQPRKTYKLAAEKGKSYRIVLEYFQAEGNAFLNFDLGYYQDVDPAAVADRVKDADAIVFVGGISSALEGEEMGVELPGFKKGDRTTIDLPKVQEDLLNALKATGKPVIFVLCSGNTIALPWENDHVDAILEAWYPGQQGGTAVADVLFGDYNPAGRLPLTFYKSTQDLPAFDDYSMTKGRTYRYFKGKPVYPFGYGLSFTTFQYGKASLSKPVIAANDSLLITIPVKNTGHMDGDEVVQLYVRNLQDPQGPIKSLRGFKRLNIKQQQTATATITLNNSSFEFFDPQTQMMKVKAGKYELLYGSSSADNVLQKVMVTVRL
ncbi:xylan 1,4-beta-xylosidase [Pinibacter soli]|uniref:Glycoside hydrolase family 3 C-terminal domain-containing protein n=1 Tax=Pinibacter soli TaxID=3044211 RepID=A0ABT6RE96_9BACT|nr:xylan 1,4-beta-xylosidase [Pinibacter soli]MDI3320904.1 glycoside hydrolase family 3 C-terminal domain-containing protein [Pinibacter soli]